MLEFSVTASVLIIAYLLGSIPTAFIISTKIKGIDIRRVGDGNMGARNTFHEIGPKFGVIVAVIDFCKGVLPVFLAYMLGLNLGWQILAAILTILGHDFPLFANFKGGQGLATSLGTMLVLFPFPTIIGLAIYGTVSVIKKSSNTGCIIGGATIALILCLSQQWLLLGYAVAAFLFVPIKLFIDSSRRRAIGVTKHIDFD